MRGERQSFIVRQVSGRLTTVRFGFLSLLSGQGTLPVRFHNHVVIIEKFRRVAVHLSRLLVHDGGAFMRRDVPVLVRGTVTLIAGLTHYPSMSRRSAGENGPTSGCPRNAGTGAGGTAMLVTWSPPGR